VAQLVEALRYNPEVRGLGSPWSHWDFSLTKFFRPHCVPGVDSASTKWTTDMSPGGKGGQSAGLTSLPPSCADSLEILLGSNSWNPTGMFSHNFYITTYSRGPGSSVGIAIDYGLDGPGLNPGGDEIFRPSRPAPGTHPASCKMGTGSLPGVNSGRGVLLTTHSLLVPRSWKSRAIPLPSLWATMGL